MKEDLLHYLWNYKLLQSFDFKDTQGGDIEVIDFGTWNHNSGPDFLFGKIRINSIILVGHIEFHVKSSDWDLHEHTKNSAYHNVILHVVYEHDKEIEFIERNAIPTLVIKEYISPSTIDLYRDINIDKKFIPCEGLVNEKHIPLLFSEEKLIEKLASKADRIDEELVKTKNNYEEVLFRELAYAFGLKINATQFRTLAEKVDFKILQKISQNLKSIEALFYGFAGWLDDPKDQASAEWKKEFDFIVTKFQLSKEIVRPHFFRLRPPNFPTLRLSQLAHLYYLEKNLFSRIIKEDKVEVIIALLSQVCASTYWDTHYNFGKLSKREQIKSLSPQFIQLLLINAILPTKYAYYRHRKEDANELIIDHYRQIKSEKNTIINQFKKLNFPIKTAVDSQGYLYLYKNYCVEKKCLNCGIGYQILKTSKNNERA